MTTPSSYTLCAVGLPSLSFLKEFANDNLLETEVVLLLL